MAVYVSNIVIEQGFDFDTSFQLEDTRTNALLDLTGSTATGQIRKHSSSVKKVAFATTISTPETGIISVSLGSTVTVDMKPGRYIYDIKIVTSDGRDYKAVEGSALVRGGVTR
tara:strand:- start:2120 stop:2458 length:339 start_codon:yes stop_codon:yes gene_type:complete